MKRTSSHSLPDTHCPVESRTRFYGSTAKRREIARTGAARMSHARVALTPRNAKKNPRPRRVFTSDEKLSKKKNRKKKKSGCLEREIAPAGCGEDNR